MRLGGAAGAPPSPSGAPGAPGLAAASGADLREEETGVEKAYFSAPLALQRAHSETCQMFRPFKQILHCVSFRRQCMSLI